MNLKNKSKIVTTILPIVFIFLFVNIGTTEAYGECFDYGPLATYDILTDSCKCISGYVFQDEYGLGPTCVSADSVCKDRHGYGAKYNSLYESCECRYGYSMSGGKCVDDDQICRDQLGFGASYNSLYDACECGYGDVIENGRCTDADLLCSRRHGIYASYDSLSESCECDSGYTLDDDSQCVEKQNNVYFKLLDLNTDTDEALIKSDYDSGIYLVEYGTGCRDYTFERYINKNIVVNLGTDYDVDKWDKIVLQDHDSLCDIKSEERVWETSFEEIYPPEEDSWDNYNYDTYVQPTVPAPTYAKPEPVVEAIGDETTEVIEQDIIETEDLGDGISSSTEDVVVSEDKQEEKTEEKRQGFWSKVGSFFKNLFK